MAKRGRKKRTETGETIADRLDTVAEQPKPKRGRKQPDLPEMKGAGVEIGGIEELDTLAEAYVQRRDDRMSFTKLEVEAKKALLAGMHSHKLEQYSYEVDGIERTVAVVHPGEETVKVKTKKAYKEGGYDVTVEDEDELEKEVAEVGGDGAPKAE